jgi:hypothetical protein
VEAATRFVFPLPFSSHRQSVNFGLVSKPSRDFLLPLVFFGRAGRLLTLASCFNFCCPCAQFSLRSWSTTRFCFCAGASGSHAFFFPSWQHHSSAFGSYYCFLVLVCCLHCCFGLIAIGSRAQFTECSKVALVSARFEFFSSCGAGSPVGLCALLPLQVLVVPLEKLATLAGLLVLRQVFGPAWFLARASRQFFFIPASIPHQSCSCFSARPPVSGLGSVPWQPRLAAAFLGDHR